MGVWSDALTGKLSYRRTSASVKLLWGKCLEKRPKQPERVIGKIGKIGMLVVQPRGGIHKGKRPN